MFVLVSGFSTCEKEAGLKRTMREPKHITYPIDQKHSIVENESWKCEKPVRRQRRHGQNGERHHEHAAVEASRMEFLEKNEW